MPNNSLITLLGTDLTTNSVGREVERPTQAQTPIEKKINYQLLYKMVESSVEEILLEERDGDGLSDAIVRLMNDRSLCKRMGKRNHQIITSYLD